LERQKRLIQNTFILAIGTFLPKFTVLVTLPIYTAMLTKAEFGTYELVNTLAWLLLPLITLQLHFAALRHLIPCRGMEEGTEKSGRIISNVYGFTLVSSVPVILLLYFFLRALPGEIRLLMCLFLWLEMMLEVSKQIARGLGDTKTFSFCTAIHAAANLSLTVLLLSFLKMGLDGLLISLNIAMAAAIAFVWIRVKMPQYLRVRLLDKTILKEMLRYSIPMVPNSISGQIVSSTDRFLIALFMGIDATAVYSVANRIPQLLGQIHGVFNLSWQENAVETHEDKDFEAYYSGVFENLFNFLAGMTAVLIAATPIVFAILIRGSYDEAYNQIPILYLAVLFNCLMVFYGGIYLAVKKTLNLGLSTLAGAVINLLINLLFIRRFGLYAASVSTLISYIVIFVFRAVDTSRWKKITYKWKRIALSLSVLAVMSVLCYQRRLVLDAINLAGGAVFALVINRNMLRAILQKGRGLLKKWFGRFGKR